MFRPEQSLFMSRFFVMSKVFVMSRIFVKSVSMSEVFLWPKFSMLTVRPCVAFVQVHSLSIPRRVCSLLEFVYF